MTLSIHLPPEIAASLHQLWGPDLGRAFVEALAIEGYRSGKLSRFQVQQMLGLGDRWETEAWLGDHGVTRNYTIDDLDADRDTLSRTFGPARS